MEDKCSYYVKKKKKVEIELAKVNVDIIEVEEK